MAWQSSPPRRGRCGAGSSHSWSHDIYSLEAERKSRAQSPFWSFVLFTIKPEPQSTGWHHPHSGLLFQPLLNLFGNTLRYSQSCVRVPGDSNSVKLTIKVNNIISRTFSNIKTDFLSFQTINCTLRNILDQCSSC